MSVYSGGDKYYRKAEGFDARAYGLEEEIGYMQSNRELLSQIRQARLAAANDAYMTDQVTGEYIEQSSAASAVNNIYSTLGGAYGYSMDLNQRNAELEATESYSQLLKKKGATADKRAASATQITMAVLAVAGGGIGALLGGVVGAGVGVAAGGLVGKGAVSAMKPGRVARKASTKAAVNYGIMGATIAAGGMMGGAGAGTAEGTAEAAQTTGGAIQSAGGISKSAVSFTENGVTGVANVEGPAQASASVAKTGWLSSAKSYADYASYGQQISKTLTPDYSDVDARYKKALYNRRYARIRGGY